MPLKPTHRTPKPSSDEALELEMALQIRQAGLPKPVQQYKAIPGRAYACDFAFPQFKVALEVDGAIWTRGRHARGGGIITDCEKQSWLAALGWITLRVTDKQIKSGDAIKWLTMALHAARRGRDLSGPNPGGATEADDLGAVTGSS